MVAIIGRSGWGALPPNRECGYMERCAAIVLHHTVTTQPQSIADATQSVRQIQRQHLDTLEADGSQTYCDIAYNFVVGPDCYFVGRGPTAHDGATDDTISTDTVSIAVLGDYRTDAVGPEHSRAVAFAVMVCRSVWGPIPVRAHSEFYATACPGDNLRSLIPLLNGDGDMTEAEFFSHPLTLLEEPGPRPVPATVQDWFEWVHREFQVMRLDIAEIKGKL